ncbi:entericidin A/B family lipoprotein [Uruburuella testudinis]|uniref:Entericidin A/B family lipoprotein n=1 Tax=Uruburuella testudinis TaxID=1282863 RepID=A0ABY4DRT8_9NEIS|nr:entericidin A/B family lipoprotein [Uruburuella testudinis]UOO81118.1 entericidin A/B family lipoprotein [Uruburuella testudinis]
MKKLILITLTAMSLLSACNTVSGFGEDVQKAGSKLEQSADRNGAN